MTSQLRNCAVTFKEVFSVKTIILYIDPCFTVTQFIENVRPVLSRNFEINENDLEIVEAGQKRISEYAPALEPSDDQLKSRWSEDLKNVSFYVRKRQ